MRLIEDLRRPRASARSNAPSDAGLDCRKRLIEIGDNVVDVLDPER
jgi:hypothetical protein